MEDELISRCYQDFRHMDVDVEKLRPLAQHVIKSLRIEFDVNIERFHNEEQPLLDAEKFRVRFQMLGFKFQRFLDSIKKFEDEEFARERQQAKEFATAESTAAKLQSGAFSDLDSGKIELPSDLVQNMFKVGVEAHLRMVKRLMFGDKYFGVTVTYHNLNVQHKSAGQIVAGPVLTAMDPRGPSTVWTETLHMAFGCCVSIAKNFTETRDESFDVLKNLSGAIESGKATLLLGPPHSGKTSFFNALSGRTTSSRVYTGEVCYNGHAQKEVYTPNIVTMVDQVDLHIATLTVRETLEFAYHCRGKLPKDLLRETADPEAARTIAKNRVNLVLATLGLLRVADTYIGNDMIKGVSGGEARRVTLGEQLVTGGKVLLLDEISTGFDITKAIRSMARVFDLTVVVSLLQPPPETYELFDDVMIMGNGNILYHGPREKVLDHFLHGVKLMRPLDVDMADFLVEIAASEEERLLTGYQQTDLYSSKLALANDPSSLQTTHPFEERMRAAGKYRRSFKDLLVIVTRRQWTVMMRNKAFLIARVFQNIVMGLIYGALFFQVPFTQWYLVSMLLMQVLSFMGFGTLAILGDLVAVRNVYYKQAKQNFFSPASFVIADYFVGLPFSCFDGFVLGSISYFMAGLSLSNNGAPYFVFLVIAISFSVTMAQMIRFFGYASPDRAMAAAYSVLFIVVTMMMSGAVATPSVIPPWYIWIYWAFSPMAWAYRSLMQNEFLSDKYQANNCVGCPNQNGSCIFYCSAAPNCAAPYPALLCGDYFLTSRQVPTERYFLWLGAGMLWIYILIFQLLSYVALRYIHYDQAGKREVAVAPKHHHAANMPPAADAAADAEAQNAVKAASFVPQALAWQDIVYTIDLPVKDDDQEHETRRKLKRRVEVLAPVELLKHISGFARPYEMLALMGSSGAGKTTLLDVLAFRKTVGRVTGTFALGVKNLDGAHFKRILGYVEQFGVHAAKSTVREALEFSALLRLPATATEDERSVICDDLIRLLGLEDIENLMIGSPDSGGGLSFEENKRVTIAVELVSNPTVVFADEPTSGLTSKEALTTMKALLRVCQTGRPVICTIHQPSAAVFKMFQRLLMLRRGGEVTFFGPIPKLVSYFESIPGVRPLPRGQNPATWMLEIQGAGTSGASVSIDFVEAFANSALAAENLEILDTLLDKSSSTGEEPSVINNESSLPQKVEYTRSWQVQLVALLRRSSLTYWRSPSYSLLRWIIQSFFALVAGTLFLFQPLGNAAAVQSRVGIMNMGLILLGNYNANVVIPFVFQRRALFYRERNSNMYAAEPFILSEQLLEDPYILFECILAICIFYWLIGLLPVAWAFFYYLFLTYIWVEFCTFLAMMWSSAMPGPGPATLLTTLTLQIALLFSGVSIPGNQLANWLLGFYYISPARWALEGLVSTQFQNYGDVMCYPFGTPTVYSAGSARPKFCNGTMVAPVAIPPLVNVTACCDPPTSLPMSVTNYVLYGQVFHIPGGGNVTVPAFLGGPNGFQYSWRYFDLLFVVMAVLVMRILGIYVGATRSFQRR